MYNALKKIEIKKNKIIQLAFYCFLISMYVDMSETGRGYNKIILLMVIFGLQVILYKKILVDKNIFLLYGFVVLNLLTCIYGENSAYVIGNSITLITGILLIIICKNTFKEKNKIFKMLQIIAKLGVLLAIYILCNVEANILDSGTYYYAGSIERIIGNRNVVALAVGLAINIEVFFFINIKKSKKAIFFGGVMLIALLITGSRKGIIFAILPTIIYTIYNIFSSGNIVERLKRGILLTLIIISCFYVIFKMDFFYNIVGKRLEATYIGVTTNQMTEDSSYNTRNDMVEYGMGYFQQKPILGHGTSNFRFLYEREVGRETYSHNNYIEILVNNGIVGFCLYYGYYLSCIIKMLSKYRKTQIEQIKKYYLFMIAILLVWLILDTGVVSYNSYFIYLIMGLGMIEVKDERVIKRFTINK